MKINTDELKKLYRAYISENIPLSRRRCPSTKKILKLFTSNLSEKQKIKTIDHISHCYPCSQEFEFILNTKRQEKKLIDEIGNLLHPEAGATSSIIDAKKRYRFFYPRLSWKFISLLASLTIITASLFVIIFLFNQHQKEYRSIYQKSIRLIQPLNDKYSKSSLIFEWEETKNADYYLLELFDQSLMPIWKSKKIHRNKIFLTQKILDDLKENNMYFWMVTAYFPDGKKIESRIEDFILTK